MLSLTQNYYKNRTTQMHTLYMCYTKHYHQEVDVFQRGHSYKGEDTHFMHTRLPPPLPPV